MQRFVLALAATLALAGLTPSSGRAQPWAGGYDPRAYRQFLSSPSPYRTYSRLSPGYGFQTASPYGYQSYYRGPGLLRQRITPWGFESSRFLPPQGGEFITPFGAQSYYVPGTIYRYANPSYLPPR